MNIHKLIIDLVLGLIVIVWLIWIIKTIENSGSNSHKNDNNKQQMTIWYRIRNIIVKFRNNNTRKQK